MGYTHGETGISIFYGKEATPGTKAPTITTQLGIIQNITGIELGYEEKNTTSITTQDVTHSHSVKGKFNFTVEFFITNLQFLFMFFGAYAAGYPQGSNPYTHRLIQQNRLPSYSFEIVNDDLGISRYVYGVKGNELAISFPEGEEIKVTASFTGMFAEKNPTPQSSAELSTKPFLSDEVSIFSMNSSEKVDVTTDLTWTYARNTEGRHSIGSNKPRFVKEGGRTHLVEAEMYQDDMELWDLVFNFTEFATVIKAVRTASNDEFTITFPKCRVHIPEQDLPGDDVLMEKATIRPYMQVGTDLLTMEVIDGIADYDP